MTYLSDKRQKSRYLNITLGLIAFGLFVYFWPAFKSVAYPLAEPLVRGYGGGKTTIKVVPSFVSTYFVSHKTLADRNRDLEVTIERLENELAERDATIREINMAAVVGASSSVPVIVLYPIAEDVTKLYSTILLSKGYKDGVEKAGIVYVRGQEPVCDIVEVYERTSLCELLSKGNRVTEGFTASSSIMLSLVGQGGGSFIAEVPNDTTVEVG